MDLTLTDLSNEANVRDMRAEWEAAERAAAGQPMLMHAWARKWARAAIEQIENPSGDSGQTVADLETDLDEQEGVSRSLREAIVTARMAIDRITGNPHSELSRVMIERLDEIAENLQEAEGL